MVVNTELTTTQFNILKVPETASEFANILTVCHKNDVGFCSYDSRPVLIICYLEIIWANFHHHPHPVAKGLCDVLENNKVNGPCMKGSTQSHTGSPAAINISLCMKLKERLPIGVLFIPVWLPCATPGFCFSTGNTPAIQFLLILNQMIKPCFKKKKRKKSAVAKSYAYPSISEYTHEIVKNYNFRALICVSDHTECFTFLLSFDHLKM